MREDGTPARLVAEADVADPHTGSRGEGNGLCGFFERKLLQFHQSLAGGQATDKGRDEARHVAERSLYLSDKLDEGYHHAVRDGACLQAVHAPEEGDKVAGAEPDGEHGGGCAAEEGAMADVPSQLLLCLLQPLNHGARPLQRLQDGVVLDALLQDALHSTVGRAYVARNASHLVHVQLAESKEARHDADDEAGQATVHAEEIEEGSHQTERHLEQSGKSLGDG